MTDENCREFRGFNFNIFFLECIVNDDCYPRGQCCIDEKCVDCPPGCFIIFMIGRFNFNIFFLECTDDDDCPPGHSCVDGKCVASK